MRNDCLFHFPSWLAIVLIKSGRLGVEGMMDGMQRKPFSSSSSSTTTDMPFPVYILQCTLQNLVLSEGERWEKLKWRDWTVQHQNKRRDQIKDMSSQKCFRFKRQSTWRTRLSFFSKQERKITCPTYSSILTSIISESSALFDITDTHIRRWTWHAHDSRAQMVRLCSFSISFDCSSFFLSIKKCQDKSRCSCLKTLPWFLSSTIDCFFKRDWRVSSWEKHLMYQRRKAVKLFAR